MRSNDWFCFFFACLLLKLFSLPSLSGSSSSCIVKFPIMVNRSKSTHLSTILMVFLLVNLTNQTVSATPLFRPQQQPQQKLQNNSIFASKPNWHDPCGLKHQGQFRNRHSNPWLEYVTPSDDDLMHNIVNMAKLALRQSRYFKEDYVSFSTCFTCAFKKILALKFSRFSLSF